MAASFEDYMKGLVPTSSNPFYPYGSSHLTWETENKARIKDGDAWGTTSGLLYFTVKPAYRVKIKIHTDNWFYFDDIPDSFMERFNVNLGNDTITFWMQKGDTLRIDIDGDFGIPEYIKKMSGNMNLPTMLTLHDYSQPITSQAYTIGLPAVNTETWVSLLEVEYVEEEESTFFDPEDIPNPDEITYDRSGGSLVVYYPQTIPVYTQDNWKVSVYNDGTPDSRWQVILNGSVDSEWDSKDSALRAAMLLKENPPKPDPDYPEPTNPDDEKGIPFIVVALVGLLLLGGLIWAITRKGGE